MHYNDYNIFSEMQFISWISQVKHMKDFMVNDLGFVLVFFIGIGISY